MLPSINSKIQKYIYFLHSQYKTQKHHLSLLSSSLHTILAYLFLACIFTSSLHYILYFILFLHFVLDNHLVRLRTKTSNLCFVGNQNKDRKIIPSLLIPQEFDIKPSSHPRGENTSSTYYILCTWRLNLTPYTFHCR